MWAELSGLNVREICLRNPGPAFRNNFPTISRMWAAHLPIFFPSVHSREKCDNDHSHRPGPGTAISAPCFAIRLFAIFVGVFFGLNPPVLRSLEDNISTALTLSVNFLISVPPQLPRDVRSSSLGWGDPTEFSPSPPQHYFPIAHPIFIN